VSWKGQNHRLLVLKTAGIALEEPQNLVWQGFEAKSQGFAALFIEFGVQNLKFDPSEVVLDRIWINFGGVYLTLDWWLGNFHLGDPLPTDPQTEICFKFDQFDPPKWFWTGFGRLFHRSRPCAQIPPLYCRTTLT